MHTDCRVFKRAASQGDHTDTEEYAEAVTSYIAKCTEDVTVIKIITARGNQEPWMTAEVRSLLTAWDAAFRAGGRTAHRSARSALSKGINSAKRTYAVKIQGHLLHTGITRWMWQGVDNDDDDASLPDRLNNFFARFEA